MPSFLLLGLISWILIGAAAGALAARFLPGRPPLRPLSAIAIGLVGALLGGLLASVLDFGGLAAWDIRSFTAATLAALVALTAWRTVKLAS